MSMNKILLVSLLVLFASPLAGTGIAQTPGQTAVAPSNSFPETLLDGAPKFGMVVFYQGDLRGNFGPCG